MTARRLAKAQRSTSSSRPVASDPGPSTSNPGAFSSSARMPSSLTRPYLTASARAARRSASGSPLVRAMSRIVAVALWNDPRRLRPTPGRLIPPLPPIAVSIRPCVVTGTTISGTPRNQTAAEKVAASSTVSSPIAISGSPRSSREGGQPTEERLLVREHLGGFAVRELLDVHRAAAARAMPTAASACARLRGEVTTTPRRTASAPSTWARLRRRMPSPSSIDPSWSAARRTSVPLSTGSLSTGSMRSIVAAIEPEPSIRVPAA